MEDDNENILICYNLAANWATGFLTKVKTTRIFSAEEGIEAFKKAGNIEITPPKG